MTIELTDIDLALGLAIGYIVGNIAGVVWSYAITGVSILRRPR